MKSKQLGGLLAAALAASLAACGGGGDDDDGGDGNDGPTQSAIQGLWQGATNNDSGVVALVLPDGSLWGATMRSGYAQLNQGTTTTSNGSIVSSDFRAFVLQDDYGASNGLVVGNATGSYSANSALLTVTKSGSAVPINTVNLTRVSSAEFIYDHTASLGDITGDWSAYLPPYGSVGTVTVQSDGSVAATVNGCAISAKLTPSGSGKNYFNATVTLGAAPCSPNNSTFSGVAFRQLGVLTVMGTTSDRAYAALFLGVR